MPPLRALRPQSFARLCRPWRARIFILNPPKSNRIAPPATQISRIHSSTAWRNSEPNGAAGPRVVQAASLSQEEYHDLSEDYMEALFGDLEGLQDTKEGVDVEYSSGVLTLIFPPAGTYVLNKQPPNKQIWLSSPVSGPKRYDWVVEDSGKGSWVYLRDGSKLTEILSQELGGELHETAQIG